MGLLTLPKRYHPDFSQPGVKPVGPVEIDWCNPLTYGLSRSYLLNETAGDTIKDLAGGDDFTLNLGSGVREPRKDGLVWVNDAASYFKTTYTEAVQFTPATYLVELIPDLSSYPTAGIFSIGSSSPIDGDPWVIIAFNGTTLRAFTAGSYFGATTNWSVGQRLQLVVRNENNLWEFFLNGVSLGTKTNFSGLTDITNMYLGSGFNNEASGDYLSCQVWDHVGLTDGQIRSLYQDPYQIYKPAVPQVYFIPSVAGVTSATTGTAEPTQTEADVATGGKTIILTLTGDTFVAAGTGPIGSTADTQAIIDGLDSAQSELTGWNNEVRDKEVTTAVVRTSDTVCTITLTAAAAYDITATETITATIPAAVLVTSAVDVVSSPTWTVTAVGSSFQAAWARSANQVIQ